MSRFFGVKELAVYLGVPLSWIYARTRKQGPDLIPHIKLGKYLRFDFESSSFQEWLRSQEIRSRN